MIHSWRWDNRVVVAKIMFSPAARQKLTNCWHVDGVYMSWLISWNKLSMRIVQNRWSTYTGMCIMYVLNPADYKGIELFLLFVLTIYIYILYVYPHLIKIIQASNKMKSYSVMIIGQSSIFMCVKCKLAGWCLVRRTVSWPIQFRYTIILVFPFGRIYRLWIR